MKSPYRSFIILFTLVGCIFLLRDLQTESLSLQNNQNSSRILATNDDAFIENLCTNVPRTGNSFSYDQQNYANSSRSFLEGIRGGNPLVDIINAQAPANMLGSTDSDLKIEIGNQEAAATAYAKSFTWITVFMVFFFLMSLVCYFGFMCTHCHFGRKLCRCFLWTDIKKYKWHWAALSLFFMVGLFIIGIAGVVVSGSVQEDTTGAICMLRYFVDDVYQGDLSRNWLGVVPASTSLGSVMTSINNLQSDQQSFNSTFITFSQSYNDLTSALSASYNRFSGSNLPRVDGTQGSTYVPDFIPTYGPPTTQNTTTYTIQSQADNIANPVTQASNNLISGMTPDGVSQDNLTMWVVNAKNITDQASKAIADIKNLSNTYAVQMRQTSQQSEEVLKYFFYGLMCIPGFCLLWWALTVLFKVRIFFCLSIGWWLLSLMAIMGWTVSFVLLPTNIAMMEACGAMYKATSDESFFNKSMALFVNDTSSANAVMYTCFYGTADFPQIFGVMPALDLFTNYSQNSITAAATINVQAQAPDISQAVAQQITTLQNYGSSAVPDNQATIDDLQTLNSQATSQSTCQPMADTWNLIASNCLDNTQRVLQATDEDYVNVGNPTCIGLDNWNSGANKYVPHRYEVLKYLNDCQDQADDPSVPLVTGYVQNFTANRQQLGTLVNNMNSDLTSINTTYSTFINSLTFLPEACDNIVTDVNDMNVTLYNEGDGVVNNMKCNLFTTDFGYFQNNLCVGFISTAFQISVVTMFFSWISGLAACSLFCLARRVRAYNLGRETIIEKDFRSNTLQQKPMDFEMATRVF